ncbi:unnamed protein product [Ranitomeya imitator]|uniref:Uncharacterized protein n=1 Tax=Ranitomeya imitator TaxID=111125 RepID=A0ABN9M7K3_9NEOB|nr:unnamed protein product [Ranitomeya imitator]
MDVICTSDSGDISAERRMARKVSRMREILQTAAENSQNIFLQLMRLNKLVIGIFSREAESQYSWLVTILKLHIFRGWDPEVRPCYISNTGFQRFCDDVSKCKFGILYHSKNRGRVNVTDVTDALYDEELQDLHSRLGKRWRIVRRKLSYRWSNATNQQQMGQLTTASYYRSSPPLASKTSPYSGSPRTFPNAHSVSSPPTLPPHPTLSLLESPKALF